ncbi:Ig-like domain-containing protein, partial [Candidatus Micrarchaeota archaeon]|nr:Ig-like domain-containing protein [Candidatus Micrarchaeota archaeon]
RQPTRVYINTSTAYLNSGDNATVSAYATDEFGSRMANATFDWNTSDSNVVYFNSAYSDVESVSIVGLRAGNATITARLHGANETASAVFQVFKGSISRIVITPANPTATIGRALQFTARAYDAANNSININDAWRVEPGTGDGTITSRGAFTATKVGTATIVAEAFCFYHIQFYVCGNGTTSVTIVAGNLSSLSISPTSASILWNETIEFVAVARNSYGGEIPVSMVWSVSNSSVAQLTVNSSNNSVAAVRGLATGNATISVAAGDKIANATVKVSPGAVDHYIITPSPLSVRAGTTQQLSLASADAYGNVIAQVPSEWLVLLSWNLTNANTSQAGVSNTGLLTAGNSTGSFTVNASFANYSGVTSGTVTLGQVKNVSLSSDQTTVAANETSPGAHLTVTATDVFGNLQSVVPSGAYAGNLTTLFTVVNGTGAGRAAADGSFYGSRAGNLTVTASVENASASIALNVISSLLSKIVVNSSAASVRAGEGVQFTAVGYDALSNAVSITPYWNVVSGSGSINASGYFISTVTGYIVVSASVGNTSGTSNLTVNPGNLHHIGFDPDDVSVEAGEYYTFKAQGYDQYGNNVTAPPLVYSLRGGTGTAEITSAGVFIGHKVGTVTVRADAPSDSSLSAVLHVTIVGGDAQRLEVVSSTGQFKLREGESLRLSVAGYDAYDNPTGAGQVYWDVSDPDVASITQDGTLTGNDAGIVTVYAFRGSANASHAFNVMPSAKPFNLIPAGSMGQTGTEAHVVGPSNVVAESTETQKEQQATSSGTGLFAAGTLPFVAGAIVLVLIVAIAAYLYAKAQAEEEAQKPRVPQKIPQWAKPPLDAEPVDKK